MDNRVDKPAIEGRLWKALKTVVDRLSDGQVTWVLTGSMSFAIQALPFRPHDIDVQTDCAGAYEIEKRFRGLVARPVKWVDSGRICSHFGALIVQGVQVEIIGDIQKRLPDGVWTSPPDLASLRLFIEVMGVQIQILPLAYEVKAYEGMGREAMAKHLAQYL